MAQLLYFYKWGLYLFLQNSLRIVTVFFLLLLNFDCPQTPSMHVISLGHFYQPFFIVVLSPSPFPLLPPSLLLLSLPLLSLPPSPLDLRLKDIPEVSEPVVLDGFDDTGLMENAFNSNFSTFKPPPSEEGESEEGSDSLDNQDLGQHGEGTSLLWKDGIK